MDNVISTPLYSIGLFAGILLFLEFGRRLGLRRLAQAAGDHRAGLGTVEGAVFALFGLLLAFTFHGAASRFDDRRDLIVKETNAIGTAYLRIDMLPMDAQPPLRDLFRGYLDSRLAVYRKLNDPVASAAEFQRAADLQRDIWRQAIAAVRSPEAHIAAVTNVLPALNEMFDINTTRTAAMNIHPPITIYALLFGLALVSALVAGHAMAGKAQRDWIHILGFTVSVVITVYITLDLEQPRHGLIRVDAFDHALVELRANMK